MNDKLTVKQLNQLVAFQKKAVSCNEPAQPVTGRILDPDEAAKLLPGMVMDYKVQVKRPPAESTRHD